MTCCGRRMCRCTPESGSARTLCWCINPHRVSSRISPLRCAKPVAVYPCRVQVRSTSPSCGFRKERRWRWRPCPGGPHPTEYTSRRDVRRGGRSRRTWCGARRPRAGHGVRAGRGGRLDVDIHVNIGAARLGKPGFEHHVSRTLARHRIPPNRLVMEITETVPVVDLSGAAAQIKRFNAIGGEGRTGRLRGRIQLADVSARAAGPDRQSGPESGGRGGRAGAEVALYRSVIGLCDAMDLVVIAEGIESAAQAETVYSAGCRWRRVTFSDPGTHRRLSTGAAARRDPSSGRSRE